MENRISLAITFLLLMFTFSIASVYAQTNPDLVTFSYNDVAKVTDFEYDELNRIKEQNSNGEITQYNYDQDYDNTLSSVENLDVLVEYEYDDRGRVIKETKWIDGISFVKEIDPDSLDRPDVLTIQGESFDYNYAEHSLTNTIVGYITDIGYNAFLLPTYRDYASGEKTQYLYDENLRVQRIATGNEQNIRYIYDDAGNVDVINDIHNKIVYTNTYDDLNRLINTEIKETGFGVFEEFSYEYDPIGNLVRVESNSGVRDYEYGAFPAHAPAVLYPEGYTQSFTNAPEDETYSENLVTVFSCSAESQYVLDRVELWGDWEGEWQMMGSVDVQGDKKAATVRFRDLVLNGEHKWNCLAVDSADNSRWGEEKTFETFIVGNLKSLQILNPFAGQDFFKGDIIPIEWTKVEEGEGEHIVFDVDYSPNNGNTWLDLVRDYGFLDIFGEGNEEEIDFNGPEIHTVYIEIPKDAEVNEIELEIEVDYE